MSAAYDMYQEQILNHYKSPRNKGPLAGAQYASTGSNPLCGDEITLRLKTDGSDRIVQVRFEGQGCAISQASASMLTTLLQGVTLEEAKGLPKEAILGKLGIPLSAVRLKCALLSYHVLKKAVGAA